MAQVMRLHAALSVPRAAAGHLRGASASLRRRPGQALHAAPPRVVHVYAALEQNARQGGNNSDTTRGRRVSTVAKGEDEPNLKVSTVDYGPTAVPRAASVTDGTWYWCPLCIVCSLYLF